MDGKKKRFDSTTSLAIALIVTMLISALVYIFGGPEFYKHWIGY
jgi:hypothetical protein